MSSLKLTNKQADQLTTCKLQQTKQKPNKLLSATKHAALSLSLSLSLSFRFWPTNQERPL